MDNYYKQQSNNGSHRRSANSRGQINTRGQANSRKRSAKKLNLKKVFLAVLFLILSIWLVCSYISKSTLKDSPVENVASVPEKQDVTIDLAVVGDIMCHSTNFADAYNKETDSYDFSYVFSDIKGYIENADLAIGNLETTFSGKDVGYSGYPTFNTPEQLAQNIKDLGVDVVSTANNHSLDKRYNGLVSTLDELDKVGLSHTGTYRSVEEQNTILTKEVAGIKFAFLSFTYGTNGIPVPSGKEYCINLLDEDLILDQISKAKALNPDIICVNMHWGDEYKLKQNTTQEKLANLLFENGVDIILGSHPHVLEPLEKRTVTLADGTTKDGFLIYSLGNFMSGQVIENTMNTIILQLKITKHTDNSISIDSYDYIPIFMYDKGAGQEHRYKILDIGKCLSAYEAGSSDISDALYNKLKAAKNMIDKTLVSQQ